MESVYVILEDVSVCGGGNGSVDHTVVGKKTSSCSRGKVVRYVIDVYEEEEGTQDRPLWHSGC